MITTPEHLHREVIAPTVHSTVEASGLGWAADFSPGTVKLIGQLEVLAAIGLIVPALLGVAPVLVPLAATGLVLLMVGPRSRTSGAASSR